MADDSQIRIGLAVDTSQLQSGMNEAASTVEAFSGRSANALAAYEAAAKRGGTAGVALGQAFDAARAAGQSFDAAMETAVASVEALNAAEEQETSTLRSNISARMAASAEMRILEGNMMGTTRAAGAFLSTLPGIGTAMQAAFPIFGALALVGVMAQLVESVDHVIDAYHKMSLEAIQADTQMILSGEKVIHVHESGLFSATGMAKLMTGSPGQEDVQIPNISARLKEIEAEKALQEARARNNEAGKTGEALAAQKTADARAMVATLEAEKAETDKLTAAIIAQKDATVTIHSAPTTGMSGGAYDPGETFTVAKIVDPAQQKALGDALRESTQHAKDLDTQIKIANIDIDTMSKKEPGAAMQDAEKYAREQMKAWEAALEEQKRTHLVGAQEEASYWDKILATLKKGTELYDEVLRQSATAHQSVFRTDNKGQDTSRADEEQAQRAEKIAELQQQLANPPKKAAADDMKDQIDALDRVHQQEQENLKLAEEQRKLSTEGRAFTTPVDKARDQQATAGLHNIEAEQDRVYYAQKDQLVKEGYAKQIEQARQAEDEQQKIRAESAARESHDLSGDAAKQPNNPEVQKNAQAQQVAIQQQLEIQQLTGQKNLTSQIQALKQQEADKLNQIDQQEAANAAKARQQELADAQAKQLQMVAMYRSSMNTMNQAVIGGINQWLTTGKSFGQAMEQVGKQMAVAIIDALIKVGLQFVETAILQQVMGTASATATLTKTLTTNELMAQSNAAVAATAALATTADPAYAAAIYAVGEGFAAMAAFETGGIIPNTGVALVHKGESVLPQPLTKMLTDTANNGGAGQSQGQGHTFSHTYAPQISVLDGKGIEGFTRRAGNQMASQMRRQARRANATM